MATKKPSTSPTPLTLQILLAVVDKPRHGYGIIKEITAATDGRLVPATGTIYLALRRMIDDKLIRNAARPAGDDERRRYYSPTALGRTVLEGELRQMNGVLEVARRKHALQEPEGSA